jgi:predicted RNA-binding Zn-ribbon protein involved in translation (DUF1610 family)
MAKKKVMVSRSGLTTCPSCMSHITLGADLAQTECPFCHTNLVAERRQDGGVFGHNTLQTLKKSKSAMLAAALGASLSMAACGGGENSDSNNKTTTNNSTIQPAYGAPLVDQGNGTDDMDAEDMSEDMAQPQPLYGGAPADMGTADMEVDTTDMDIAVPEYGAPATDM